MDRFCSLAAEEDGGGELTGDVFTDTFVVLGYFPSRFKLTGVNRTNEGAENLAREERKAKLSRVPRFQDNEKNDIYNNGRAVPLSVISRYSISCPRLCILRDSIS